MLVVEVVGKTEVDPPHVLPDSEEQLELKHTLNSITIFHIKVWLLNLHIKSGSPLRVHINLILCMDELYFTAL